MILPKLLTILAMSLYDLSDSYDITEIVNDITAMTSPKIWRELGDFNITASFLSLTLLVALVNLTIPTCPCHCCLQEMPWKRAWAMLDLAEKHWANCRSRKRSKSSRSTMGRHPSSLLQSCILLVILIFPPHGCTFRSFSPLPRTCCRPTLIQLYVIHVCGYIYQQNSSTIHY